MGKKLHDGELIDGGAKAKKGKNRLKIIVIVVAVIAVLGVGFSYWHSKPSFCSAICHQPMDAYVKTFEEANYDVFGNELDETQKMAMCGYAHQEIEGMGCLDCHKPVITEQVSEAIHWMGDSYPKEGINLQGDTIIPERTLADLAVAQGIEPDEFCLKSGCHVTADGEDLISRDQLIAQTADLSATRNPHDNPHAMIEDCSDCHKAHSQSINACTECHADAPLPDGWLTFRERQALIKDSVTPIE